MEFVQKEKMSKKQKAAMNKMRRVEWNFSPVSRVKPSKKIYDRKKGCKYEYDG